MKTWTISSENWKNFCVLLDAFKDSNIDVTITDDTIAQQNNIGTAQFLVNSVCKVDDLNIILNGIKNVLPVLKVLGEDSDIKLTKDDEVRKITISDDESVIELRYTLNVVNNTVSKDSFEIDNEENFKVPTKVLKKLDTFSNNFQNTIFNFSIEDKELVIKVDSLAKNRSAVVYKFKGFSIPKWIVDNINEFVFDVTPINTFYKLVSKLRIDEKGQEVEEFSTDYVILKLGMNSDKKPVLLLEFDSQTRHHIKILCRKVEVGVFSEIV